MKKCKWLGILIVAMYIIFASSEVYAASDDEATVTGGAYDLSGYDLSGIDEIMSGTDYESESFSDMVGRLMSGDSEGIFLEIFNMAGDKLVGEIDYNKDAIAKVVLIAIAAAMLSKLSAIFMSNKMSDMGFFSVYTLLLVVLMSAFAVNTTVARDVVDLLLAFMKCLIPAFFMAVGAASGMTASVGLYEIALVSIMAVEYVILNFVIPAINVYVVILLLNNILDEDYLSKFASVVETVISWAIKMIPTIALAINLVGSIVLPSVDYTKAKGYRKIFSLIPGIGQGIDSFVEIVAGSGSLIKNAIGGAALVCIIVLVAIPVVKLLVFCFMYKITAAIVQPVSDKRVTSSVEVMSKGANMLYRAILACGLLFFLTIAIVCLGTGKG
ncbi:MAG: stage III sporulation protein AE [Lachnospiraceae bacterium]|nr:stage III sporulation protein AE [Lachnospiraceae bacterium]